MEFGSQGCGRWRSNSFISGVNYCLKKKKLWKKVKRGGDDKVLAGENEEYDARCGHFR